METGEDSNSNTTYQTAREVPGSASDASLEMDAEVIAGQATGAAGGSSVTLTGGQQATGASKQRDTIKIEEGLATALKPGGVFQLGGHNQMTIYKNEGSGDGAYKFRKPKHPLTTSRAEPEYRHLDMVSSKLAGDWRRLGRQMGLDDSTLDQIRQDFHVEGQHEVNYRMLMKWKQNCVGSGHFTLAMMAKLLADSGRGDIADELRKG
ncbi:hypothetical protein BaRGS_00003040 [Batillaria attramentaria]|uniref:Death domain-containing protein n=1 Tax=Batillaria attramentaria TaxID=370345 RepID=A0ABD0M1T5_9CAEN